MLRKVADTLSDRVVTAKLQFSGKPAQGSPKPANEEPAAGFADS